MERTTSAAVSNDTGKMSPAQLRWARRLGVAGILSRSVTFVIIGGFLIEAAVTANPDQPTGLGAALQSLASQPCGTWLLAAVAAGLVAYGVFCVSRSFYRQFETPF